MSSGRSRRDNPWDKNYGTSSVDWSPLDEPSLSSRSRYHVKSKQPPVSDPQASKARQLIRQAPLGERLFGAMEPNAASSGSVDSASRTQGSYHPIDASNSHEHHSSFLQREELKSGSDHMKRCTRHTPQTELQLLGTASIWLVLLLPGIMTLLVLAIPAHYSMQIDRIPMSSLTLQSSASSATDSGTGLDLSVYNCSGANIRCQQFSLREDGEEVSVSVLLHPERSVSSMGFLGVSIAQASPSAAESAAAKAAAAASSRRALAETSEEAGYFLLQSTPQKSASQLGTSSKYSNSLSVAELSTLEMAVTSTVLDSPALVTIQELLNRTGDGSIAAASTDWRATQARIGDALRNYHVDGASLGVLSLDLPSFLTRYESAHRGCRGSCHLQANVELPLLYTSFAPPNLGFSHYAQASYGSRRLQQRGLASGGNDGAQPRPSSTRVAQSTAMQIDEDMGYSHWFQTMLSIRVRAQNESSSASDRGGDGARRHLAAASTGEAGDDTTILSRFFENQELVIVMQSELFLLFDIILRLALSTVTLYLYYIWWVRTWPHLRVAASVVPAVDLVDYSDSGVCSRTKQICKSCWTFWTVHKRRALRMFAVLLPEQLTSAWMLFFLFVWQSPLSGMISLFSLCGAKELPAYIVGIAVTTRSLAKYGLFFCALVYIEGLKFFPGDTLYLEEDEKEEEEEEEEEDSTGKLEREANADDVKTYQMLGASPQSTKNARSSADLFFQDSMHGDSVKSNNFGPADNEFTPFSPNYQRNSFQERASADGELDLADAHGEPLTTHHVLSTDFLDFIWRKAAILFLSWLSVFFFYQCQSSAISYNPSAAGAYTAGVSLKENASQTGYSLQSVTMFILLGLISQLLFNYWIILLFLAARSTNRRLKKMSYSLSRFRQLAFRLFLWQFYFWLAFLLLAGVFRWRECMHIVKQQFGFFSTSYGLLFEPFGGVMQQIRQYFLGDQGMGGAVNSRLGADDFSRMQLEALIYLSSDYSPPFGFLKAVSLVSLSALCYTIAYTLTPPKLAGAEDTFVAPSSASEEASVSENNDVHAWQPEGPRPRAGESSGAGPSSPFAGRGNGMNTDVLDDFGASHAFIPLECDMPPLRSWDIFDSQVGSVLLQNPKLAYARLHRRMSASLQRASYQLQIGETREANAENRDVTVHNVAQPFCLETACALLEVSYQAYFRPAGEGFEVPESLDWGLHVDAVEPVPDSGATAGTNSNPFDDDTDEDSSPDGGGAEAAEPADGQQPAAGENASSAKRMWTRGPAMDLQRCNLRMLSTFYDTTYSNFGTVSQTETPAPSAHGEVPVLPSRIVVCYRGTTEVKQAITDFKFHQAHLPDFRKTRTYFRRAVREKERQSRSRSATANKMPQSPLRSGGERDFSEARSAADGASPHSPTAHDDSLHYGSDGSPGYDLLASPVSPQDEGCEEGRAAQSAALDLESGLLSTEQIDGEEESAAWSALADAGGWLRTVVSRLPILQHTLPLIHLGFKDMYMCIREQALSAVVHAMYAVRRQRRALVLSSPLLQAALREAQGPSRGRGSGSDLQPLLLKPLEIQFCGHSLGAVLAMLTAYDVSLNMPVILHALDDLEKEDLLQGEPPLSSHSSAEPATGAGTGASTASSRSLCHPSQLTLSTSLSVESFPHIAMYSYGQPKPGNVAFCAHIAPYLHSHYRVELDGDLVTTIPPNYYRVYAHAGTQVIVDPHRAGTLVVNPSVVESYLLAGHHANMQKHAMERYRQCLLACFEPSELAQYLQTEYAAGSGGGGAGGGRSRGGAAGNSSLERELARRLGIKNQVPAEMPGWMYK